MEQQQQGTQSAYDNQGFNNATALQYRLGCEQLYYHIYELLSGGKISFEVENGEPVLNFKKTGEPKCNEKGVQSILGYIIQMLNNQTVQGNLWDKEMYGKHCSELIIDVTDAVVLNVYIWEINDKDLNFLINSITRQIELFWSRLYQNKERESYSSFMKISETQSMKESGGGFKLFKPASQ